MEALKSCPFCGGDAKYRKTPKGFGWIECTECGAESRASYVSARVMTSWNTGATGWIKTSERLPEQKTRVLISNGKSCDIGQLHEDWLDNTLRRFWSVEGAENLGEDLITYWMPLPEPPEVEE